MYKYDIYFRNMRVIIDSIEKTQQQNILKAAMFVSECIANDGLVHAFGTGHSHILAREIAYRAGSLAPVDLVYDPALAGALQMEKSSYLERLEGYGRIIIDYIKPAPEDIFIIISNSGRNAVPIETALEAKKKGNKVIAVTSVLASQSSSSRHSSGKHLFEVADVVLDNCGKVGDVAVKVPELEQGLGPTSTIAGAYLLNAVMIQSVFNLLDQSIDPPVLWSGNLDNGMEHNESIFAKYRQRIRFW